METGGGVSRRRMLTADRKFDSPNLRDFLRVKDVSNSNGGSDSVAGVTLGDVLCREPRSTTTELPHRTLLDIIRDEPFVSKENRKTWKHFTEKLRLKLPGSACTSTVPATSASDTPLQETNNRMTDASHSNRFSAANTAPEAEHPSGELIPPEMTTTAARSSEPRRDSDSATLIVLLQRSSSHAVEAEANGENPEASGGEFEGGGREDQPARLSLMALLAETDRELGIDRAAYVLGEEETDEETAAVCGGGEKLIVDQCCVCMVRHKGAAFIPCGHTFCRMCSRELWVQRGSCPLCNNSISEILDIF